MKKLIDQIFNIALVIMVIWAIWFFSPYSFYVIGSLVLLAIAIFFFYLGQTRKGKVLVKGKENHFVAIERTGGKFVKFILTSQTYDFKGKGNDSKKWKIKKKSGGPQTNWIKDRFGYDPVGESDNMPDLILASRAKPFVINRNSHKVIRPKQKGEVLKYKLYEDPIVCDDFNIPMFITHTFETSPINTMGEIEDPRDTQGKKVEMSPEEKEQRMLKMVATVVGLLQVQIWVFNPYLALYMTQDFMKNVNTTLQSGTREIVSELGFLELIMAKTETIREGGDVSNVKKDIALAFAERLMTIVNGENSLKQYGVAIVDPDFLDHHLADPRVEKALNDAQVESLEAVARDIRGSSEKRYDMERAKGRAAETKELIKASSIKDTGADKDVVLATIDARKTIDGIGAHKGTVLSLGGSGIPAIVDGRPQPKHEPAPKDEGKREDRKPRRNGQKAA